MGELTKPTSRRWCRSHRPAGVEGPASRGEPTLDAAYYHLGLAYLAGERRDDAKLAFRRARDLAPQSPFGQTAVGQLRALGEGG